MIHSLRSTGVAWCALAQLVLALASPPTPHIVFVMVDDLGYNDVGYHSDGSKIVTDNIDALAADGLKLESYYVAPLCTPSRSQFLTGKYLIHNGMQHLVIDPRVPRCLPLDDVTMANKLSDAGYASHLVGKWHLGFYKTDCWPLNRGFQSFFGLLLGSGDHFSHNYTDVGSGNGRCGYDFTGMDLRDDDTNVQPDYEGLHSTTIFTERAQSIIRDHDPDQPLFMYLAYQAPHLPFEVPDEYFEAYRGDITNKNRRTYAGMVTMLDEAIGNLTDTLKEEGLWDDTVLVFSTDNGGVGKRNAGNNWPLRGVKGTYFEGGIRGVGFVTSPLLSDEVKGTISTDLMHVTDWFPTLVEGVANVALNYSDLGIDGVNMWDVISQGESGDPDREIVFNIDPELLQPTILASESHFVSHFDISYQASIRKGDMKLITGKQEDRDWLAPVESTYSDVVSTDNQYKAIWLYNITADPTEQNDLSATMVDVAHELLERLQEYYTSSTFVSPNTPRVDCDADPANHGDLWTNWE
ncbi:arylsulfatase B-like [Lytechinus variegatus]|uniref:arylsulfatase B-like n=1 Tax=Lytechinus variegatus TaxID=7654 RepID=UPI001BB28051|nr:arylsulfatase B-like [Lytechinus variegatus]XP_041480025.1 arylsulfatase B-like [Lytechinus variegatus]